MPRSVQTKHSVKMQEVNKCYQNATDQTWLLCYTELINCNLMLTHEHTLWLLCFITDRSKVVGILNDETNVEYPVNNFILLAKYYLLKRRFFRSPPEAFKKESRHAWGAMMSLLAHYAEHKQSFTARHRPSSIMTSGTHWPMSQKWSQISSIRALPSCAGDGIWSRSLCSSDQS